MRDIYKPLAPKQKRRECGSSREWEILQVFDNSDVITRASEVYKLALRTNATRRFSFVQEILYTSASVLEKANHTKSALIMFRNCNTGKEYEEFYSKIL